MQLRFTTTGAKTSMNTIFDCSRVKGDKEPKLDLSARLHLTRGCADFSMEKICYADKASSTQTKKCATKLDIITHHSNSNYLYWGFIPFFCAKKNCLPNSSGIEKQKGELFAYQSFVIRLLDLPKK